MYLRGKMCLFATHMHYVMIITIQLMNMSDTECGHSFIGNNIRETAFTNLSMTVWLAIVSVLLSRSPQIFFSMNDWNSGLLINFSPFPIHPPITSIHLSALQSSTFLDVPYTKERSWVICLSVLPYCPLCSSMPLEMKGFPLLGGRE